MTVASVPLHVRSVDELPTPALVFNSAGVKQNIERLAKYAISHNLKVRPHTKTHKSLKIASMQLAAGACGLTFAKVGEAEVMSDLDAELLIAYPVFDRFRAPRVAELAKTRRVIVAIDSAHAATELAEAARSHGSTIGLLVDIDVGMGRTGVATPHDALELAQAIDRLEGGRLDGIMCYPGHVWMKPAEQSDSLKTISNKLRETIDLWRAAGLDAKIVSGGSTPTAYQSHLIPELTEIRPGTYVFNDLNELRGGFSEESQCAAKVIVTVVSTAVKGQMVIDAGTKTLTSDLCGPQKDSGHGAIIGIPQAKIVRLTEEHGQVDIKSIERDISVGDRLEVIPNHICPCVNLQNYAWWQHEDGSLERMVIDGRGMLS